MNLGFVAAVYAAAAWERTTVGPFMASRPLVVGPLVGYCLGNAPFGLLVGGVAEMLWMHSPPEGPRSIDASAIAGLATLWSLDILGPSYGALTISLAMAVPFGFLMRAADAWARRGNDFFDGWVTRGLTEGDEGRLREGIFLSLLFGFIRNWGLFAGFAAAGAFLLQKWTPMASPRLLTATDWVGRYLPLIGFCCALNYFIDRSHVRWSWIQKPFP